MTVAVERAVEAARIEQGHQGSCEQRQQICAGQHDAGRRCDRRPIRSAQTDRPQGSAFRSGYDEQHHTKHHRHEARNQAPARGAAHVTFLDNDATANNSVVGTFDLTPSSSYMCQSTSGAATGEAP